jgi:YHS domain-containing protein
LALNFEVGERQRSQSVRDEENGRAFARVIDESKNLKMEGSMTKDPVCGMKVDDSRGEFQTQFAGKKYFFCSDECRKEFEAEPDAYVEVAA